MDCFDADVLIFAADPRHPLGARVRALFTAPTEGGPVGIGSVLLMPEVMSKPLRDDREDQLADLATLLARLDLRPLDHATARVATALAAQHRLRAADAVHLATAVVSGADRFITNNRKDFPKSITEVDITYPDDLADA
jgi:predicted nucleic acid-binding protein